MDIISSLITGVLWIDFAFFCIYCNTGTISCTRFLFVCRVSVLVRFTVCFRSTFLEISKFIHFWNHQSMGYPKINVGICSYSVKAAILDFQYGRHI